MANREKLKLKVNQWHKEGAKRRILGKQPETQIAQSSSSSSSTPLRDIAISGPKAGVETLAKAGATALAKSFLSV